MENVLSPSPSTTTSESYAAELGKRVSQFRKFRGMSLRLLAEVAGLSSSFISQLENGRTNASIASVRKIADALNITAAELFKDGDVHTTGVLRAADRPTLPFERGNKYVISLLPLKNVEVYSGEFEPGASTGPDSYVHGNSQEFFIVTEGSIRFELAGKSYEMFKGDSIEFLSSVPHRAENVSDQKAEVMWIASPPSPDEVIQPPHVDLHDQSRKSINEDGKTNA
jgi:transcriptional regulator with XRE-family HTH domain